MSSIRSSWRVMVCLPFVCSIIIGCTGSKNIQEDIVWPAPPDEPRIEYIKTYESEDDFLSKFGKITRTLTGGSSGFRLDKPFAVATDGNGKLFVSDVSGGVFVFDETNREVKVLGENSVISLESPRGIAYGNNKLFVGLVKEGIIVMLDMDGKVIGTMGKSGQFLNPIGVVYDKRLRRVIIVDTNRHQVFVFSENGDSLLTIGKRGEEDGDFNFPQSAAVDSLGNIYVVDGFNFRVEEFSPDGKFLRKFGSQGNIYGTFSRPKGIALDAYGNIYVVDALHQNFQIFDQNFDLLMFVGRFSNNDNRGFQNPIGICIDQRNTIYVADQLNQRVQRFQLLKGN